MSIREGAFTEPALTEARLDEIVADLNAIEALDPTVHSISDTREEYLSDQPEFDFDRSTDHAPEDPADADWNARHPGTWYLIDGSRVYPTNAGWTWSR